MDELVGIGALRADLAFVDRRALVRCRAHRFPVLHHEVEGATRPTVGAGRLYVFHVHENTFITLPLIPLIRYNYLIVIFKIRTIF